MAQQTLRFYRTVRHLQPSQIAWRLHYTLKRSGKRYVAGLSRTRAVDARVLDPLSSETHPPLLSSSGASSQQRHAQLANSQVTLFNRTSSFNGGEDWEEGTAANRHRLWRSSLHEHWWLAELAAEPGGASTTSSRFFNTLADWLQRYPSPRHGSLAWNSYVIAGRLMAWREILVRLPVEKWQQAQPLRSAMLRSFVLQAEHLYQNVEWDLRGNHLIRDAAGLACAAEICVGRRAERWALTARKILTTQLQEQLLEDGGHFERSPMYHLHVAEDLARAVAVIGDPATAELGRRALRRMAGFARWVQHPDGAVAQFNDGAAWPLERLVEPLAKAGIEADSSRPTGGRHLHDFGLVAWHDPRWTVFFDVGPIGPAYQPGHAHADSLSVEASFGGRRLLVDPGSFAYDNDEARQYDRATESHNTVCIDRQNSSEVWHIFRVGRRARTAVHRCDVDDAGFDAAASHDGYRFLADGVQHHRRVICRNGVLEIVDQLDGRRTHHCSGGWLIPPTWSVRRYGEQWRAIDADQQVRIEVNCDQKLELERVERPYHPDYGRRELGTRLQWSGDLQLPVTVRTRFSAAA